MSLRDWEVLFFNGTYNYSMKTGRHLPPAEALPGALADGGKWLAHSLGKENVPASLRPIQEALCRKPNVVVFCGTDNVEELAFLFALNRPNGARVVFVGSMRPMGHPDYDGNASLATFQGVYSRLSPGSWVIVGSRVIDGRYVRKARSVGLRALTPLAKPTSSGYVSDTQEPEFDLPVEQLISVVPIVTVALGDVPGWLDWSSINGLVIAGSGTGSIPDAMLETVVTNATNIPVCVSTRCMEGPNHEDELYPGSADRYERCGLIVKAYSGLNPLQSRIRLMLELANGRYAGCA